MKFSGFQRSGFCRGVIMTKKEIVKMLSEKYGLTQLEVKEIVQGMLDTIIETLVKTGKIELRNFGVFKVKERNGRVARNPRTGDIVNVPPRKVVTFKPGRLMEQLIR
jgi:nucleoid DNA-binding protein